MINFQNFCKFQGRLTKDPVISDTKTGKKMVKFTLAVDNGKDRESSFLNCTAFDKTAEFIGKFFSKGKPIQIISEYRTRTTGDGDHRQYFNEFVISAASFCPFVPRESEQEQSAVSRVPKDDKDAMREQYSKAEADKRRQAAADAEIPPIEQLDKVQESQFDFGDTQGTEDVPF